MSERFRKEGYDALPTYREEKKDASMVARFPLTGKKSGLMIFISVTVLSITAWVH